jgi:hypothetical protein
VSFRERASEHGTREPVDLHDDQAPPESLRAAAAPESTDQAIEGALYEEKQVVQRSAPCSARPVTDRAIASRTAMRPTGASVREAARAFKKSARSGPHIGQAMRAANR